MSTSFRKGVQYNMKIVIRGDVMTGKSMLFNRLQGAEYEEAYSSTSQIQVANIPWHYKDSSDIVKIEVWDVVDKAHNNSTKKSESGIKLEHHPSGQSPRVEKQPQETTEQSDLALDASTVNVYRNSHAVIFMFDITKPWTFNYVKRNLEDVPETVAVLVLGNFSDKSAERKVSLDEIHAALYDQNTLRIDKGALKPNLIRYAEASMKTGLGLKFIYDYLGVPFMQLMMESLRKQLELKAVEIVDLLEDLDVEEDVPSVMRRRRGQDNFDQPADTHLAQQHNDMKKAWDEELEMIAAENPSPLDTVLDSSFYRADTPPPPAAPADGRTRKGSLISDVPPAVELGETETLDDDWFKDEPSTKNLPISLSTHYNNDSDGENPGNPMVAGDEDVESIEYYDEQEREIVKPALKAPEPVAEESDHSEDDQSHQPPIYKSDLSGVWGAARQMEATVVHSDSEDEDNVLRSHDSFIDPPYATVDRSSPFGFGGYEEIGGHDDNPWSAHGEPSNYEAPFSETTSEAPNASFYDESETTEVPKYEITSEVPLSSMETTAAKEKKKKTKKKKSKDSKKKKSDFSAV
ncbi:uncharacterized protein BYT42DRAFT_583771 [Radiomyces spectabilis]|uniref:uncharacterized protein n=1 Tax=Radiomyces spectabilis TaxID=64574 RepID=UPI00221EDDD8|nr:uncharacterized protein BYT42DRAFT_583771 [Radiomyces spectabilis]KAI8369277.1 hypothetical protein BYT42DRAFT_583771 [Radiomyces spectabilis]